MLRASIALAALASVWLGSIDAAGAPLAAASRSAPVCKRLYTLDDHADYTRAAYKRSEVDRKAQRRIGHLRRCQALGPVGRKSARRLTRKVRARYKARKRSVAPQGGGAGGILAAIRWCESKNDYTANTGNGFYGAYQFTPGTWAANGGTGMPHLASPAEQDRVAANLYAKVGTHTTASWPNCP